jgi:hypothetical protein
LRLTALLDSRSRWRSRCPSSTVRMGRRSHPPAAWTRRARRMSPAPSTRVNRSTVHWVRVARRAVRMRRALWRRRALRVRRALPVRPALSAWSPRWCSAVPMLVPVALVAWKTARGRLAVHKLPGPPALGCPTTAVLPPLRSAGTPRHSSITKTASALMGAVFGTNGACSAPAMPAAATGSLLPSGARSWTAPEDIRGQPCTQLPRCWCVWLSHRSAGSMAAAGLRGRCTRAAHRTACVRRPRTNEAYGGGLPRRLLQRARSGTCASHWPAQRAGGTAPKGRDSARAYFC